jgi:hypothetical protein
LNFKKYSILKIDSTQPGGKKFSPFNIPQKSKIGRWPAKQTEPTIGDICYKAFLNTDWGRTDGRLGINVSFYLQEYHLWVAKYLLVLSADS